MIHEIRSRNGGIEAYWCEVCNFRNADVANLAACQDTGWQGKHTDVAVGEIVHLSFVCNYGRRPASFEILPFRVTAMFYLSPLSSHVPRANLHDACVTVESLNISPRLRVLMTLDEMFERRKGDVVILQAKKMNQNIGVVGPIRDRWSVVDLARSLGRIIPSFKSA
jgi:hypothetical protein